MNQITPEQALANLDNATEPQNIGRLTRVDFVNVQASLVTLQAALKRLAELEATARPESGKP